MRRYSTRIALPAAVLWASALHAQDRPLDWDFAEVYRVGGVDVPEWAQFTRPDDLAFDAGGNLYVLDASARHVVKIGPDGRLVRTIGRAGEGPGEFVSPQRLVVWQDGSLAVTDSDRTAVQLFDTDGNYVRQVRWTGSNTDDDPLGGIRDAGRPMRPGPRTGIIYAQGTDAGMSRVFAAMSNLIGGQNDESVDEYTVETLNLADDVVAREVVLRAWQPPRNEDSDKPVDLSNLRTVTTAVATPYFEPDLRWDATPGGSVAYVDSTTYAIRLIYSGELVSTVTRPIEPMQVTGRIESDLLERELNRLDEQSSTRDTRGTPPGIDVAAVETAAREAIENREFYPEVPVITAVRAAWDGGLWIQRRGEEPWDEAGPIDVFSPDGTYLGTLPADGPGMPGAFGPNGLIAHWERDEVDVPSIVVQRVPTRLR